MPGLEDLAVSRQRAAVAAAAAAMRSPATPRSSGGTFGRSVGALGYTTPIGASRLSGMASLAAASPPTPTTTSNAANPSTLPPRTSFKQQAQQLQEQRRGSLPPTAHPVHRSTPTSTVSSSSQRQRPLQHRHAQQQQQQQQRAASQPPPNGSLEDALGLLVLGDGHRAAADAATPTLKLRSRGLPTPQPTRLATPRAAAGLPAAAGNSDPLQTSEQQAGGDAILPATPVTHKQLGGLLQPQSSPLWSPMLPAAPAGVAQGAGLLSTLRKAPAEPTHSASGDQTTTSKQATAAASQPTDALAAWQPQQLGKHATQQPSRDGGGEHGPAQLRRQLQAIAPELTLTLPPAAAPQSAAAQRHWQQQRTIADRGAAQGLLDRMAQLREAGAVMLQEQAAPVKCIAVGDQFRSLLTSASADGGGSTALAVVERHHAVSSQQKQQQQLRHRPRTGPGAAAVQRLVQLRRLQCEGAQLTAQLA